MAKLRYISLFSGIEAWSCAVAGMPEYEAVAFSEIDPFACAVLKHHYPEVPNLGDITQVNWEVYRGSVDLIVGGSPCQGFSQAGYRKGLRDSRSSLALSYVQAVESIQPRWLLWENVPGVLSTNNGEDFRSFLAALDDLGFGLAWAVLDSQWFGVAQRRRRVFVVGHAGSWERAAQVLFKPSCLQRHPPSRRKAGQGHPAGSQEGSGDGRVAGTLCSSGAGLDRPSASGNQLDFLVTDTVEREREHKACRNLDGDARQDGAGRREPHARSPEPERSHGPAPDSAHRHVRIVQPMRTAGTLLASGAGTERIARDAHDFLILDIERETVAGETCGALLSRDGKGMSSTIDGKLIAVRIAKSKHSRRKNENLAYRRPERHASD